ncbi:dihydroneopterin aldolase [Sphingobacterium sp. Mn56C]|uniref:dihydroneopterin aldolase n=1 Tax=Sphingobacterium sp. Mn56C TaxID=3395261 RepID=UPI003BE2277F
MITQKIALNEVRFFSPIGFYDEELVIGNEFYLNVSVYFPFDSSDTENLANSINYEEVYAILVEVMTPERRLLESAVADILQLLQDKYPFITRADISIRKTNPAFGGDLANSEVALYYKQ